MASSPVTSWQIDGETVETVSDFILDGQGGLACCDSWGRRDMIKRLTLFQVRAAGLLGPDQGGAQVSVASDE